MDCVTLTDAISTAASLCLRGGAKGNIWDLITGKRDKSLFWKEKCILLTFFSFFRLFCSTRIDWRCCTLASGFCRTQSRRSRSTTIRWVWSPNQWFLCFPKYCQSTKSRDHEYKKLIVPRRRFFVGGKERRGGQVYMRPIKPQLSVCLSTWSLAVPSGIFWHWRSGNCFSFPVVQHSRIVLTGRRYKSARWHRHSSLWSKLDRFRTMYTFYEWVMIKAPRIGSISFYSCFPNVLGAHH